MNRAEETARMALEFQSADQALSNAQESLEGILEILRRINATGEPCPYPLMQTERIQTVIASARQLLGQVRQKRRSGCR